MKNILKAVILKNLVDREKDCQLLQNALQRVDCQFIVVYGRRRIGKSTLIKHVLQQNKDLYFLSDQTSEQNQRQLFANMVANLFKFFYRFVAPYASILELGAIDAVMNVVDSQMSSFVGECWESLCRRFVGGNVIDGVLYDKASRWWGKVFTDDCSEGETAIYI